VPRSPEDVIAEIERHDLTLIGHEANFQIESKGDHRTTREKILRRTSHPVLLVPDDATGMSDPLGPTVLVAYDGGPAAARALASFVASGLGESRDVHIATVGDDGEKAMETAMHAVENLRASGINATAHGIVSILPDSEALVEFGARLGAGLVVMGAFARSRFKEMFSGSLTRALVRAARPRSISNTSDRSLVVPYPEAATSCDGQSCNMQFAQRNTRATSRVPCPAYGMPHASILGCGPSKETHQGPLGGTS